MKMPIVPKRSGAMSPCTFSPRTRPMKKMPERMAMRGYTVVAFVKNVSPIEERNAALEGTQSGHKKPIPMPRSPPGGIVQLL